MASSSKQGPVPPVSPPGSAHHWEGDGTLHSYCYDYMIKRGWTETAAAFAADAGIDENEWKGPPIEAPQGLLYEWWSVFWDVFIARSQKTGHRNVMADTYVEAMRSKREPQIVQFAGMPGTPPIALPRSLAHPARTASASGPPHPSTPNSALPPPGTPSGQRLSYSAVPGQMLALQQQQQLQEQLQGRGMPPPGLGGRPVPLQQQPYHVQSQPQGPGPPPPQSPVPQGPAYPPNPTLQQHTLQSYAGQPQPPQPQPSQPSSNQSSPHVFHAPHPYANGAGGANGAVNGRLGPGPGQPSPVPMSQPLLQAMAAIGLSGRDPASLTPDEEVAVQNQMRRLGVMPATPAQQQYYRSQQQAQAQAQAQVQQQQQLQHQQQHQHQQHQQQQMQIQQQQQQQLGIQRPPLARVHSDQQRVGSGQFPSGGQQQHLHERQLMQQQMLQQQVQLQQQGIRQEPRDPRELQQRHQQMAYASSQVGSPSSPAYSAGASPYATPLQLHMLPPQSTAGAVVSPATAGKGRGAGIVASKASPAPPKRAGVEDPSPRGRKRARGSIKDEEQQAGVGTGPKTPRFEMDGSGPPSPALSIGALPGVGGPQFTVPSGQPYRPARSPSLGYDSATRGALDAIQIGTSTGRILGHQQHQLGHDDSLNGDVSVHGSLVGNGSISRPGSSASNYLIASNSYINPPDVASPNASNLSSRPPSVAGNPADLYSSSTPLSSHPPLHISIPSPLPPGAFSLGVPVSDATPGGSRPFAGAHPLISTPAPGESNGVTPQPGNPTDGFQYMAGGGGSGSGGNDLFADLSGLDFSLDSFIDHDLFNDKDEHLEVSLV